MFHILILAVEHDHDEQCTYADDLLDAITGLVSPRIIIFRMQLTNVNFRQMFLTNPSGWNRSAFRIVHSSAHTDSSR